MVFKLWKIMAASLWESLLVLLLKQPIFCQSARWPLLKFLKAYIFVICLCECEGLWMYV